MPVKISVNTKLFIKKKITGNTVISNLSQNKPKIQPVINSNKIWPLKFVCELEKLKKLGVIDNFLLVKKPNKDPKIDFTGACPLILHYDFYFSSRGKRWKCVQAKYAISTKKIKKVPEKNKF